MGRYGSGAPLHTCKCVKPLCLFAAASWGVMVGVMVVGGGAVSPPSQRLLFVTEAGSSAREHACAGEQRQALADTYEYF